MRLDRRAGKPRGVTCGGCKCLASPGGLARCLSSAGSGPRYLIWVDCVSRETASLGPRRPRLRAASATAGPRAHLASTAIIDTGIVGAGSPRRAGPADMLHSPTVRNMLSGFLKGDLSAASVYKQVSEAVAAGELGPDVRKALFGATSATKDNRNATRCAVRERSVVTLPFHFGDLSDSFILDTCRPPLFWRPVGLL